MKRVAICILLIAAISLALSEASFAAEPLTVTVSLNKTSYDQQETVMISGTVLDSLNAAVSNAIISIQVNDPSNNLVHVAMVTSGSDGRYVDQFIIGAGMSTGPYTVYVTASKSGYTDITQQTNYTVIPEFSEKYLPLLTFGVILAILILLRKKSKH